MTVNQTKGKIYLVGVGPGEPKLLTDQCKEVLSGVDFVVGYALYVDQVRHLSLIHI